MSVSGVLLREETPRLYIRLKDAASIVASPGVHVFNRSLLGPWLELGLGTSGLKCRVDNGEWRRRSRRGCLVANRKGH